MNNELKHLDHNFELREKMVANKSLTFIVSDTSVKTCYVPVVAIKSTIIIIPPFASAQVK